MNGGGLMLGVWVISLLLLVTVIGEGAVCGSPLQSQNAAYEEYKCRDTKTNREMYIGEVFYRRGQCVRVQCLGSLQVWEDRCQVPNLEGNCSQIPPANEFLDYPKCCPLYECKFNDGNTQETRIHDHYGNKKSTYVTQVFTRRVENGFTVGKEVREEHYESSKTTYEIPNRVSTQQMNAINGGHANDSPATAQFYI